MVTDEKVLEELYELLTLYFNLDFSPGGIFEKTFQTRHKNEPQLDKVIFKEKLLAIITETIMKAKG